MHIITGLILSALLGGNKKKGFRGFRGVIEVLHSIPSRVRFYVPSIRDNEEACHQLEKQLLNADAIQQIKINPLTGTILIMYYQEQIDVATLTGVLVKLLELEEAIEERPESLLGKEITAVLDAINRSIYESTNGMADLNSLVTTTFLTMGLYALLRGSRALPAGLSLLFWAYNTSMHQGK
jgi:hypothetical protein